MGHFNAHHLAWGSHTSNALGHFIAEKTLSKRLIVLNNGSPTRVDPATGNTSAIDITFCSENLVRKLMWQTLSDTHNSDHFPILVYIPGWSKTHTTRRKWMHDRADWDKFESTVTEAINPEHEYDVDEFTEKILTAADVSIPRTSGKAGPKAVPWWCPEVNTAIKTRRKQLRILRRLPSTDPNKKEALRLFQEARQTARKVIQQAKQQSWESFVARISSRSTSTDLWRTVNSLRDRRQIRTLSFSNKEMNSRVARKKLQKHWQSTIAKNQQHPATPVTFEK